MNRQTPTIALMSAQNLPLLQDDATAPEWVHLLPAVSGAIQTGDQRGPYHVTDANQVIELSFAESDRLPIDENHATDLAAPKGHPSPARGWIVEMQAREDGIWGRVEWSKDGAALVSGRAYRALSPVITHDKSKRIGRILRASLVNVPNLRGLVALNHQEQEPEMDFLQRMAELLGLAKDASEEDVTTALQSRLGGNDGETALQSQMGEIAVALGLTTEADHTAILNAAQTSGGEDGETIVALQAELKDLATELNGIKLGGARDKATAFVDKAIADRRVGVVPLRDKYIAMHMKDATGTEELINAFPRLDNSHTALEPPTPKDGEVALNAEQRQAAVLLGIPEKDYAAQLAAEQR
ncbi:phage protease [Thalassovita sp.]|uniref:phage protease n=1 Tax=Thalassovita sp. TaxID=1979401 RepID=UPI002B274F18|nr:phage protease [Thalassovita sp.]